MPSYILERDNLHLYLLNKSPDINHLQVFRSIIYIFIYKEEENLKFEKFETQILKDSHIRYDEYTIYRLFIQD